MGLTYDHERMLEITTTRIKVVFAVIDRTKCKLMSATIVIILISCGIIGVSSINTSIISIDVTVTAILSVSRAALNAIIFRSRRPSQSRRRLFLNVNYFLYNYILLNYILLNYGLVQLYFLINYIQRIGG